MSAEEQQDGEVEEELNLLEMTEDDDEEFKYVVYNIKNPQEWLQFNSDLIVNEQEIG